MPPSKVRSMSADFSKPQRVKNAQSLVERTQTTTAPHIQSIAPLYDRVVIRRAEVVNKIGSIILADSAVDPPNFGYIVAVGAGYREKDGELSPMALHVDQLVAFGKYAGTEFAVNGETLLIMREEEIMAVLNE
jgi:chaperonin GroES